MENLRQKQLNMQKDMVAELSRKVEELSEESRRGTRRSEYSLAKALLNDFEELKKRIEDFRITKLQKLFGKFIREDEDRFNEIFQVDYKNIDDAIAKPLAIGFIVCFHDCNHVKKSASYKEALKLLRESKEKFRRISTEDLDRRFEDALNELKNYFHFDRLYYGMLENDKKDFIDKSPQRAALALSPLSSVTVASVVISTILSILYKGRIDEDATEDSRQNIGLAIGETLLQKVRYLYLKRYKNMKEEKLRVALDNPIEAKLWSDELLHIIGSDMVDIAWETGLIDVRTDSSGMRENYAYVSLDPKLLKKLQSVEKKSLLNLSMIYKPMIVEPLAWKGMRGGGYLQENGVDDRFRLDLIKSSSRQERVARRDFEIPQTVLNAVNSLQRVPYRINEKIFEVLSYYRQELKYLQKKNKVDFAYYRIKREITSRRLYDKTSYEVEKHMFKVGLAKRSHNTLNQKDKKRIRVALDSINKALDKGIKPESISLQANIDYEIAKYKNGFDVIMSIAEEMMEYGRFHFVWRMDFRGRLYPQQTLLHPQGGDIPKALLLFADTKPLEENGLEWLMIHGANTYGEVDKRPFEERLEWVRRYENAIVASANDFKRNDFWKKADDPFRFLAFCFEYARYLKDPKSFTTSLPIAIDGSNNGFQHISTLLRDIDGARRVNVLPAYDENGNIVVADVYNDVKEEFKRILENIYSEHIDRGGSDEPELTIVTEKLLPVSFVHEIVETLQSIDGVKIKGRKYITEHILERLEHHDINDTNRKMLKEWLKKIEGEIRKEMDESPDFDEVMIELESALQKETKLARRRVEKGVYIKKDGKVYEKIEVKKPNYPVMIKRLLDSGIVDRSFVKKPVMTESYGSSTLGKAEKIAEALEKSDIVAELTYQERKDLAKILAEHMETAIEHISPSSRRYNRWMKKIAGKFVKIEYLQNGCPSKLECQKIKTKDNHCVCAPRWMTPLGLCVLQVEYKSRTKKLSLFEDRKVTINIYTDEIDDKAHRRAMPPNFIHSLDASHLMITVNRLHEEKILDLITVHDSFASHACDMCIVARTLRETFIELHRQPILEELSAWLQERYGIECEKIPYQDLGNFDFEKVRDSLYLFA